MFRKGGLTQRQGYAEDGIVKERTGPSADDVTKQLIFLKESLPAQKDDRLLRYFSRAAGQIGNKPQPGTTGFKDL